MRRSRPVSADQDAAVSVDQVTAGTAPADQVTADRVMADSAPADQVTADSAHGGNLLATAATTIGVTEDELMAALQSGQSIADVATANGIAVQSVIDALVAQATTDLTERITGMVNGTMAQGDHADDDETTETTVG